MDTAAPHRCHVCLATKAVVEDSKLCALCHEETRLLLARERDMEAVHKQSQDQVNAIFDLVDHPHLSSQDLDKQLVHLTKFLTIQFNKLKMLNLNIELNTINAAIDNLKYRIRYLNVEVELAKEGMEAKSQVLGAQREALQSKYNHTLAALDNSAQEYQQHNVHQIRRHLVKQRLLKYKSLRLLVFAHTESNTLLFYGQSIIPMSEFVSYNILSINNYLENLIRVQIQLQDLFAIDFPYLDGLRVYLPTSDFYTARQEKEHELKGEGEKDDNEPGFPELLHVDTPRPAVVVGNSEKVLKLGDQIKLPLSSKTLNRQRRLSKIDQRNTSRGPSPQHEESQSSVSRTASPVAQNGSNRKMVIVPHRILRLPFSRLSIREFLKFLLVVSKIIINFDYFLLQIGSCPRPESATYDMYALLEQVYRVDECLQQQLDAISSPTTPSAGSLDLHNSPNARPLSTVDIHPVMEKLYELMIVETLGDGKKGPPEILRNLNVRDFIISYKVKHDWDVIQK